MKRVIAVVLMVFVLVLGGVVASGAGHFGQASAQLSLSTAPALAPTVHALQTTVSQQATKIARLDTRVTALETRVALGSGGASSASTLVPTAAQGGSQTVSGTGTMVSDKFHLDQGRYKVSATLEVSDQVSGFIVQLNGPNGAQDSLFNELIQNPQTWTGSTVVTIATAGDYFVDVSNTTAPWTLTFAPY